MKSSDVQTTAVTVFGIRHHGPGSARSLRAALEELVPDIVLVEGPPDARDVLPLIVHDQMQPPVALLVYTAGDPRRAAYFPFTVFSPEWQALRFAFEHGVPARFMDLPQAIQMAPEPHAPCVPPSPPFAVDDPPPLSAAEEPPPTADPAHLADPDDLHLREDPFGLLAKLAGYDDRELWWEHQVEQRRDAAGLFAAILEVMAALRAEAPAPSIREAQREAFMRQTIRAATKEGFRRIAVVCGAWHAPVLARLGPAKDDAAVLKDLPRIPVTATWIPWTNSRLSSRSGYGAGVESPGWYEHLWHEPAQTAVRWIIRVARLLRDQDIDASSAGVIEAVRLADALAALRNLSAPGLAELDEAILTVLCHGEKAPMALIRERLEIGECLGGVPDETPAVPLQQDLAALQRRLRLKPSAEIKALDLDLRNDLDRDRSRLLHRLRVLNIPWGKPQRGSSRTSTFHEPWVLQWQPELAVALIDAGVWGTTVEAAAISFLQQKSSEAADLPALSALLESAILAALPSAVQQVLDCVQARAALATDLRHLMDTMPPLARVARYGNVRETPVEHILPVVAGLFERVVAGLVNACASLDDDAAVGMAGSMASVQAAITLLDNAEQLHEWRETLQLIVDRDGIHGLVRGWACRMLLESGVLGEADLQALASRALSPANPATQAAAWVEGVLRGSGMLLLQLDGLWRVLDAWMSDLSAEAFAGVLPLLRRAFSNFQAPERRSMGEKVARLHGRQPAGRAAASGTAEIDPTRAALVLPILARILGVPVEQQS